MATAPWAVLAPKMRCSGFLEVPVSTSVADPMPQLAWGLQRYLPCFLTQGTLRRLRSGSVASWQRWVGRADMAAATTFLWWYEGSTVCVLVPWPDFINGTLRLNASAWRKQVSTRCVLCEVDPLLYPCPVRAVCFTGWLSKHVTPSSCDLPVEETGPCKGPMN